ncbi:GGDEF domain-containing protein [Oceanobacter mangrovi]|uniref:GGDEF domain-containing protein n=1 Tax=Oceanobacter mangrovi TaxID=2862510 RepID=UPI001C8F1139|nr:diguanylate cyclase [Oceanobacter mangrovi]
MISVAERHARKPWLRAMLLLFAALATAWLTLEHFWLGYYDRVLWQMTVVGVLLLAAALVWIRRSKAHQDPVVLPALLVMALPGLMSMETLPALTLHSLLVPPLLGYFCLREKIAHALALALGCMLLLAGLVVWPMDMALRCLLQYVMITGSVACYTVMTRQRDVITTVVALRDWESTAYNGHQLETVLERELCRSNHVGKPLSLIGFQIDDFAQLKEQGDAHALVQALPRFVAAIREEVRAGDEVFRLRDDLFVLMLPGCPEDGSIVLMERIRRHLLHLGWQDLGELSVMTTTVTSNPAESAYNLQRRLITRMAKQKRASLQSLAF